MEKKDKLNAFFASYAETESQLDYRLAHEVIGQKVSSIHTGSLLLDEALSSGGLPNGRIIQFYGPPASGKTLMTMIAMKEAQKKDPDAKQVFIDAEQTFSTEWAETLGLDTSKIIVVDGDMAVNGRRCFEMILGIPKEDAKTHALKGQSKEGLLDKIISKELNINLIVLDSLGAIIPAGEDISSVGKMNISLLARFLTTTLRKLSLAVAKAKIPFIIINHKKSNMDPYAGDHTYSGGNSYSHFLSHNIYFEAVNRADARILDSEENKIGQTIRATVEKSKYGPAPRKCEFRVDFGIGIIDQYLEIIELALKYDVIVKTSNVSYEYGDQKWVGYNKLCDAIKDDPAFAEELMVKIDEAREVKLNKKRQEQESLKKDSSELDLEESGLNLEEETASKKKKTKGQ